MLALGDITEDTDRMRFSPEHHHSGTDIRIKDASVFPQDRQTPGYYLFTIHLSFKFRQNAGNICLRVNVSDSEIHQFFPVISQHLAYALVCPVSYTHLRAHETVLDLVCRLLL